MVDNTDIGNLSSSATTQNLDGDHISVGVGVCLVCKVPAGVNRSRSPGRCLSLSPCFLRSHNTYCFPVIIVLKSLYTAIPNSCYSRVESMGNHEYEA